MSHQKKRQLSSSKREIFVLLTYPPTLVAKVIGFYTRRHYTHASIALDSELSQLYSFGRKRIHFPLFAGFIHEDPAGGVFALTKDVSCKVFKVEVSDIQYQLVCDTIQGFIQETGKYRYNFLGLLGVILNRKIPVKDRYFCSEFVAKVLSDSGIRLLKKHPEFVRPDDFLDTDGLEEVYTGTLNTYLNRTQHS